jgi:hypothetical protein
MKRKLAFIIMLALSGLGFAHAQHCRFDLIKTDPFSGETELRINTRYDNYFSLYLYRKGETFQVVSNVEVPGMQNYPLPFTSKLDLKLGNDTTFTLESLSVSELGSDAGYTNYSITYSITKEQFTEIAENGILYIRTHLRNEAYYDYALKKSETEKVKSKASCILNYQPGITKNKNTSTPSGYFSMDFGLGVPVGSFADKTGDSYGGYASPGFNMNYTAGIPIKHSNFGIALKGSWYLNSFDIQSLVNTLQSSDPTKTYEPSIGAKHSDFYTGGFILGGLFATCPVNNCSFDFKLTGGVALCHMPLEDYEATENTSSYMGTGTSYWTYTATTNSAFAYDLGVDFRINSQIKYEQLNPWQSARRMGIIFGVDIVSAKPTVNLTEEYNGVYATSTSTHTVERIAVSMLTFSFGWEYSF